MRATVRSLLRPPLGFAHRGASARAPENTLEAFRLALELGASGLESDVWLTSDGIPILDHDGEFERGGQLCPVGSFEHRALPEHVPSLADLYACCGADHPLSLDVKDPEAAPAVVRVAAEAAALGQLWLCHWNWKTVAAWRELSAEVRLVDSTRSHHMRTPPEARALRMAQLGLDAINLHHRDWTREMVETFHRHGRLALAWDTQTDAELVAALALGVDAVYSDHVDRMTTAIAQRQRD